MPPKKGENRRNPNWNRLEAETLVNEIIQRNSILKAAHGSLENAEAKKKQAWESISSAVSAISPIALRSVDDCKTKYGNVIKDVTKKVIAYNKELHRTGKNMLEQVIFFHELNVIDDWVML